MTLNADTLPFHGRGSEAGIKIELYVVTGRHGILTVPESYCKECNLFYKSAKEAAEEADFEVDIQLKSYWTRFLRPLLKGGTHPPVMLVNGDLVAQGYDVPDKEFLLEKIESQN